MLEKLIGPQHGLASGERVELDGRQEARAKAANPPVAGNQCLVGGVSGGARQGTHLRDGIVQGVVGVLCGDCRADRSIGDHGVTQNCYDLRKRERGGIQVFERPHARLDAGLGSLAEQGGHDGIEHIENGVVAQGDQGMQGRTQGGRPARIRETRQGLRPCGQGKARQGVQATQRELARQGGEHREIAELDELVECIEQALAAGRGWQATDLLERGEVRVRGDDQQGIKLLALREGQIMGQDAPDAVAGPVTDAGDIAG